MAPPGVTGRSADGAGVVANISSPLTARSDSRGSFPPHGRVLTLVDQGMVSATTFVTAVAVGRAGTPAELGVYMLGLTLLLLLIEAQNGLISTPFMVLAPRLSPRRRARSAGTSLLLHLTLAAVTAVLLGGFALLARFGLPPGELSPLIATLALAAPVILLREHLRRLSLAALEVRGLLSTDAIASAVQLLAIATLLGAGAMTPSRAFLTMAAGAAAGSLAWMWTRTLRLDLRTAGLLSRARRYLRLGRWVFASGIAWACALHLFPWLLAGLHGAAAAGVWAACFAVANAANPLLLAIGNWVGPAAAHTLARLGPDDLRRSTFRTAGAIALIMLPIVVGSFLWGDLLVRLVYGGRYAGHGGVVGWLMVHVAVTAVGIPASRGLFALHRADADFRANAAQLVGAFVIGSLFVWRGGAEGAAIALALTSALAMVLRTTAFARTGSA